MGFVATDKDARDGISEHWLLCEELSVIQAALLIVGKDPASEYGLCEGWQVHERPEGYEAVRRAIWAALRTGRIKGSLVQMKDTDINGNFCGVIANTIDVHDSHVEVESLTAWLESKGMRTGFFYKPKAGVPDHLNPQHPRYSQKLAAVVRAWEAAEVVPKGLTPKGAVDRWLRANAGAYGLIKDDGSPNESAIQELSKIANWAPQGGVPKTPGE